MRCKKRALLLSLTLLSASPLTAQDPLGDVPLFYGILFNMAPDDFKLPLVGVFNFSSSAYGALHIGAVNFTQFDFSGVQAGLFNNVLGSVSGWQAGAANITAETVMGVQTGFVNAAFSELRGLQIGLVNTTSELTGFQIGLFNYVDSINSGFPIGLVNVVREGYHALEISFTEVAPLVLSYKFGADWYYTTVSFAFDFFSPDGFGFYPGVGTGIRFPFSEETDLFFFNPEFTFYTSLGTSGGFDERFAASRQFISISALLGCNLSQNMAIVVGPSVTWIGRNDGTKPWQFMAAFASEDARLALCARVAMRFSF